MDQWNVPNSLPPVGLTGLFQVKDAGATPQPLKDLRFTFAAEEFYYRGVEQVKNVSSTFSAVGGTTSAPLGGSATVPAGKAWMVTGLKISAVSGAAELVRMKFALIPIAGQVLVFGNSCYTSATDAAGVGACAVGIDKPMLIGPGYTLGAYIERVTTAASITLQTDFRFIEFPL